MTMTREEMYRKLKGKKVACMQNGRIKDVGIFKSGRMSFTVAHTRPLKRMEYSETKYFLYKGDEIQDIGEYILIRRGTEYSLFIFF